MDKRAKILKTINILIIGKSILETSNIPVNNIAKIAIINKKKYIFI